MSNTTKTAERAKFDKDILISILILRAGSSIFSLVVVNGVNVFCLHIISFKIPLVGTITLATIAFLLAKYISDWLIANRARKHIYSQYWKEFRQKETDSFKNIQATLFICFVITVIPTFTSFDSYQEYFLEAHPINTKALIMHKSKEPERGQFKIEYQYQVNSEVYEGEAQIFSSVPLGKGDSINILYCSSIYNLSRAYP